MYELKTTFLFLILILLNSCVTQSPNSKVISEPSECLQSVRTPSSFMCRDLLNKRELQINGKSIHKVISDIPEYFEGLKKEYEYKDHLNPKSFTENFYEHGIGLDNHRGERLYQEIEVRSDTANAFLKLGFKKKGGMLEPPETLQELYGHYYREIFLGSNSNVAAKNVILPAFIFTRREGDKITYLLSRPGVDPLPSTKDGWRLLRNGTELDHLTFSKSVSEGKFPFEPQMYSHDVGHLIDYILEPNLMNLHREFFRREYNANLSPRVRSSSKMAGNYLNEFLQFPKTTKHKEWQLLIESRPHSEWDRPSQYRKIQLEAQAKTGALFDRITKVHEFFFEGVNKYGGGSNDGRSMYVFIWAGEALTKTVIGKAQGHQEQYDPIKMQVQQLLTQETIWGMLAQMRFSKDLLIGDRSKSIEWDNNWNGTFTSTLDKMTPELKEGLTKQLIETVELFERKIYWSLRFGLTAEKLFEDMLSPEFESTDSYRFYQKVAQKNTMEYRLFIEGYFLSRHE